MLPGGVRVLEREIAMRRPTDRVRVVFPSESQQGPLIAPLDDAQLRRAIRPHRGHRLRDQREGQIARRRCDVASHGTLVDSQLEPHASDAHGVAAADEARSPRRDAHGADEGAVGAPLVDEREVAALTREGSRGDGSRWRPASGRRCPAPRPITTRWVPSKVRRVLVAGRHGER